MPIVHDFIPVLSHLLGLSWSTVLVVVVMVVVVERQHKNKVMTMGMTIKQDLTYPIVTKAKAFVISSKPS